MTSRRALIGPRSPAVGGALLVNDDCGQAGPRPRHRAGMGGAPGPGPRPLAAAGALEAAMWVASEMGSVGSE